MVAMFQCPDCKKLISENAETCPKCGRKVVPEDVLKWEEANERSKKAGKKIGIGVGIFIVALAVIGTVFGPSDSGKKTAPIQTIETESNADAAENPPASTPSITTSQKNALRAAQNYLRTMPFSHKGLVGQLEFEGYAHDDAVYAADNCGADWNEQAAKSAKNYLDIMPFSKDGLIEQLEFEGYTHDQAVYGAKANRY